MDKALLISPDGIKLAGKFKDGKLIRQGTVTYPDGSKLIGKFKNGDFMEEGKEFL